MSSLPTQVLISWLILVAAVWLTSAVLSGFYVKNLGGAVIVAALLRIAGFSLAALPAAVLTTGSIEMTLLLGFAASWIIGAIILQIIDAMTDALEIDNFGWALAASLMITGIATAARLMLAGAMFL